ncbi:hypothetical protein EG329_006221 [Mollisiaceae sp. DMI_Dod_QoI]|nr:hypothetical protein EG329_006221 [Helotiales sp. DMI_Dod_QoI]
MATQPGSRAIAYDFETPSPTLYRPAERYYIFMTRESSAKRRNASPMKHLSFSNAFLRKETPEEAASSLRFVVTENLITLIAAGREEELYEMIKEPPPELEHLYASIVFNILPQTRNLTHNYLQLQLGYCSPDNLLAMTLASAAPDQVRMPPPDLDRWSPEMRIVPCHRMKRILRDSCSSLIQLPHFNPSWTEDEKINLFYRSEMHVHKTIKDYLFAEGSFEKYAVSGSITAHTEASGSEQCHGRNIQVFLLEIHDSREVEKLNLSVTWLPAIQEVFRVRSSYWSEIVDFHAVCVGSYIEFERRTGDPSIEFWNADLLYIAVAYRLIPDLKTKLKRNLHLRKGRPLLHYIFGSQLELWYEEFESIVKLLHRHGSRFDQAFNGRTTWEYILIYFKTDISGIVFWTRNHFDKIFILYLELRANPNQRINFPDYQCSALHVMVCNHNLPHERLQTLLKAFLIRGAATDTKDSNGCSVVQLAEKNWPRVVALLKSRTFRPVKKQPLVSINANTRQKRTVPKVIPIKESLLARIKGAERP